VYRKHRPALEALYKSRVRFKDVGTHNCWVLRDWQGMLEDARMFEDDSFTRSEAPLSLFALEGEAHSNVGSTPHIFVFIHPCPLPFSYFPHCLRVHTHATPMRRHREEGNMCFYLSKFTVHDPYDSSKGPDSGVARFSYLNWLSFLEALGHVVRCPLQ
jgi:hypothetical protein